MRLSLTGKAMGRKFKTIESYIMDLADDIAYSTYDLEDCLKAGFLTPADILSTNEELVHRVADKVSSKIKSDISAQDVLEMFKRMFSFIFEVSDGLADDFMKIINGNRASRELAQVGVQRTRLTSGLVEEFIDSVRVEPNRKFPALSEAYLEPDAKKKVEILKSYTYEAMIDSARVRVAEYRGYEVVSQIFDALSGVKGHLLMPEDVRKLYNDCRANASARKRVVCDFVSGMTDRYAVEFYGRLHSESAESMFKPI
jgi:dGTPase